MNYFYSVLILLLLSCNISIHQYNLDTQCKTMIKQDEQSRKKQQKIRDSRKKRVKVYKIRNYRKFV